MVKVALIIIIFVLIPSISFYLVIFDNQFYKKEFNKYEIYAHYYNADELNSKILNFLIGGDSDLNFLNEKEIKHLIDVRNIIQRNLILMRILIVASISYIIFYLKQKNLLIIANSFIFSTFLWLCFSLALFILITLNFNFVFILFHKTFFKPGTWLFEPNAKLVKLYPEEFFYDITLNIILSSWIIALILLIIGLILRYKHASYVQSS